MIQKINNPVFIAKNNEPQKTQTQQSFTPQITEHNNTENVKIPLETYKAYSSINFKGREYNPIENAYTMLSETAPDETVSTKEAINILSPLNLTEKKLLEYLLACSFDTHNEDVIINKQALLYAVLLNNGLKDVPVAKIPMVIASSLDNENKCFSENKFESLFNAIGQIRMTKIRSLKRPREDNYTNARKIALVHKSKLTKEISEALKQEPKIKSTDFEITDIFDIDLEKEKQSLIETLEQTKTKDEIPDTLFKKLKTAIENNNFNLKGVYAEYYSLLNDCKTLDEAKELYPEIKIPDLHFEDNGHNRHIRTRLQKEDINKIGLNILKNIYVEQKQPNLIIIDLENSYPTTYEAMIKSGIDFGKVPDGIQTMVTKSSKLIEQFGNIDSLDDRTIEFMIRKNATKESRIWAEYIGITNKYWHPVRAIAHKQRHPLTSYYKTEKLVDGYLFYLYKYKNQSVPSKNPLEIYTDGKPFTKEKKAALEKLYFLYRNNKNKEILSKEFLEFKKNFDLDEMAKSVTKLERHYKNTFANWFMTPERRKRYEDALENSYRLVFEKLDICKLANKMTNVNISEVTEDKLSNEELVEYIEETEDNMSQIIKDTFNKTKNIVYSSGNDELTELFKQYIGTDSENIDEENFLNYQPMIENEIEDNKIKNPEKLVAMFKLNNMYLNYLFNTNNEQVTFDEYTKIIEEKYKNSNGSVDYTRMNNDFKAKEEYETLTTQNTTEEKTNLTELVNKKFIDNGKNDYNTAALVISMYNDIPNIFKTKFYNLAASTDKIKNEIFVEQLKELHEKITSWNLDSAEIITMDADRIPQKIVITSKAKYELLDDCHGDLERFDVIINKFFNAATKRVGEKQGQGIKALGENTGYCAELKIQGGNAIGNKRLYARAPLPEDIEKYGNVKYVFDTLDEHL